MLEIIGYKNTRYFEVRFFKGDDSDQRRLPVPINECSVAEIKEFPDYAEAFKFQTRVQTEVFFSDGSTQSFDKVLPLGSQHYFIKRDFAAGIDLSFDLVSVHPSLENKIRVIKRRHTAVDLQKTAA